MTPRRLPIVAVVLLALLALVVADRTRSNDKAVNTEPIASLMPTASPPGAVSSAFFCTGAATPGAFFNATLVVANPNATPATVLVTSYPGSMSGDAAGAAAAASLSRVSKTVAVAAQARSEIAFSDLQVSPFAALVAETNDPGIAVERRIVSPGGTTTSTSPCASASSDRWFVPTGTTTRDAQELLAVFNPFPVDAVLDVTFQTSDGFRNPPELQALPVPGGQLRVLDISKSVPRLEQLSATVSSRSGRVIVERMQRFDGSDANHPAGQAITLGAPAPSQVWVFGDGEITDGFNETYTVVNPSDRTVSTQVQLTLEDPATNGTVDPITLDVPARTYTQVVMRDQTRVLPNVAHSVVVRTQDPGGLIVERVLTGAPPSARRGYAPSLGSPLLATRWVLADGRAVEGKSADFVTLVNPSADATAHVQLSALGQGQLVAIDGLQDVELPPGGRVTVDIGQHVNRADLPIVVESDRPVAVERGLYNDDGTGMSFAAGIPMPDSTVLPPLH